MSSGLPGPLTFAGGQHGCPLPRLTPRAWGGPGGLSLPRCCWSLSEALDRELRLDDGREPPRSACASCRSCKSFVVSSKFRWLSSWSSSFFTFPVQTGQDRSAGPPVERCVPAPPVCNCELPLVTMPAQDDPSWGSPRAQVRLRVRGHRQSGGSGRPRQGRHRQEAGAMAV